MVLRINGTAPDMDEKADQALYGPPGVLLRSVFVALIVATTFAVAGMLLPHADSGDMAIFGPRCEHLEVVEAASCSRDFLAQRDGADAGPTQANSRSKSNHSVAGQGGNND